MYNQRGAMNSKSIVFRISICKDQPGGLQEYCKKEAEIKKFINEMSVQLWMINSAIDMRYL